MGMVGVVIDPREPDWIRRLPFGGVPVMVAPLDMGSLQVVTNDAILLLLRKTPTEFLHAVRDNHLLPAIAALRERTPWAYLLITGQLAPGPQGTALVNGTESNWNWASVSGALLSVQELGGLVLQLASERDYEHAVIRLAQHERGPVRLHPQREAIPVSDAELVLLALPGIGPDKAQALLKYCGSAAAALDFLTDDTSAHDVIHGIGAATKRKIRQALGLCERDCLVVAGKDQPVLSKLQDIPAVIAETAARATRKDTHA